MLPANTPVSVESINAAAIINSSTDETGYSIPPEEAEGFNTRWRKSLYDAFPEATGARQELEEWLATGLSNGRQLQLQGMALKPGKWFRVHQHPNIEFEMTLAGALHEVRLTRALPVTPDTTPKDDAPGE